MAFSKEMSWAIVTIAKKYRIKIDRESLARVSQFTWYAKRSKRGVRFQSAPCEKNAFESCSLGRLIMNCEACLEVAFVKSSDPFDYRRSNLRKISRQQRQSIIGKRRLKATSRYKGVSRNKMNENWRASICVNGKTEYLGEFQSEVEAAEAYNTAAKAYFGELAFQNET